MELTRRDMLMTTGAAALGSALAGGLAGRARAQEPGAAFDIDAAFAAFMADIGGAAEDGGGAVTFTGEDPILRSHFRIGASMALPAMAAAVGAAAIWKDRTGEGQDVSIDLREAVYNVNPLMTPIMQTRLALGAVAPDDPVATGFTFTPTINGNLYQAPVGLGNPFSFVPFRTKDGRFMNITAVYPHLLSRALKLLDCPPTREAIAASVATWNGEELEAAMFEAGVVGVMHRTTAEWLAHPEGAHLAGTDLIEIRKVADGAPVPWTADPTQPLSGIKALSLTHVIAGSTAARTLSEYGAEVLHIMREQSFEHEVVWTDVNIGMRSANLDLNRPDQNAALAALLPDADVFIDGFSGRGIERLGFGIDEVVAARPKGVVYLTVRGYSWDGPWKMVRTFDMEAVSTTGFTITEGSGGYPDFGGAFADPEGDGPLPAFPPTLVMNDYIAGYLGGAGVIAALRRRAAEGGSYHVHVNLARAAMWYASLGIFGSTDFTPGETNRMIAPETIAFDSPYGRVSRLAPMAKLAKTPGKWQEPLLTVRGSDLPVWKDRL
ncbi:MAG: carnitine dehydratase [Rhodovulum sulfidophilum]|uniref:Carnitine dehydratase n=1 Tax=Rhodovulum sulfidophilum TaxID=35806 RepID=A0A2W5N5D1_RHOSU|nr:MAG: carnitine dehydratase [Rhodovulum sulfidophilum]